MTTHSLNINWDWNLVTGQVWWNDNFYALLGDSPETAPPSLEEWQGRLHPEDAPHVQAEFEAAIAGKATDWSGSYRLRRRDGDYAEVEDYCHIQRDTEGRAIRLVGAMQDVTRRNTVERQALQAADHHQRLLRASKDSFWLVDAATGRLLDVNSVACDLSGYSREEMLNRAILDFDVTHDSAQIRERSQRMLDAGGGVFETRHRTRDGRVLDVEVSVSTDAAARLFLCFIRDVTERKRTEQVLKLTQVTIDRATDAVYWIRQDGSIAYANEAACRSLEFEREELLKLSVTDIDPTFPPELLPGRWTASQAGPIPLVETLHRTRCGRVFPVEVNSSFIRFDGVEYIAAFVRDISHRKRQEQSLRLSQFALERATDAVYWVHPDSSIFYVNEATCRMLGYSREELSQMAVTDLDAEYQQPQWDAHWAALKAQGSIRLETTHRTRDGRLIPVEIVANYIQHEGLEYDCAIGRDISDRKATEHTLRTLNDQLEQRVAERTASLAKSEERLRLALEATHEGLWDWNILSNKTYCSPMYFRMLGYQAEDLGDDMQDHFIDLLHPEDRDRVLDSIQRGILGTGEYESEFRLRASDGDYRWILSQGHVVERDPQGEPIRAVGTHTDITARKLTELALAESYERLRKLSARVPGVIYQFKLRPDGSSCFPYASEGIRDVYRVTPEQVREDASAVFAILHPDDYDDIVASIQESARTQAMWRHEFRVRFPDGTVRWLFGNATPEPEVDGSVLWHGCIYDITERKLVDQQVRELNANLERKVEERTAQLATASAAKTQFLAHMSHELRTPMNAVLGLAQLLEKEPLEPGELAMVRHIRESGDSLLHIINDILDFSKIEAGQLRLDPQPFTLPEVFGRVDNLLRITAESKGLVLNIKQSPTDLGVLLGDSLRVEQILVNLIGNAIKFTAQGAITLSVRPVTTNLVPTRVRFEVQDTGIGIAPDVVNKLFLPFSQADASITRNFGGTGLGLAISRRLVELMGGQMGVFSEVGQGSTFWFEVPFHAATRQGAEVNATEDQEQAQPVGPQLSGLRVLAVDDSRLNLMVVERALKLEGVSVTLAADGQQALQILKAQPQAFDVVLMDIQMPVMDGLTATQAIRKDPVLAHLPVIALTAGVLPEERQAALNAGVNAFLAKPLDLQQMQQILAQYLSLDDGLGS